MKRDDLAALVERLRDRLLTGLHMGHLRAGDRLPSIREVAHEAGVDHRVVTRAFHVLRAEGLIEVRGRSGAYVARQERLGGEMMAETARWMAGVLTDAWRRRIAIPELPELVRRCTASVRLRCAVVEASEDHRVALATEGRDQWGVECFPVPLRAGVARGSGVPIVSELRDPIRDADLVLTTAYCAALVRPEAEALGKPLVAVTANPELVAAVERRLRGAGLTVVCADPAFGERVRGIGDGARGERVRVVLADDVRAVAALDPAEPVLLTRAARARLGDIDLPLVAPHSPSISPESARELAEVVIRLNMEHEGG